jgi:hypothetical protein
LATNPGATLTVERASETAGRIERIAPKAPEITQASAAGQLALRRYPELIASLVQLVPPVVVVRTVPPGGRTTQALGVAQATAICWPDGEPGGTVHVEPPSVELSTPFNPTAKQVVELGQLTPSRAALAALFARQVNPSSPEKAIHPPSPTATQVGPKQLTPRQARLPSESCRLVQVSPPSLVRTTTGPSPTATQTMAVGQLTPCSTFVVPDWLEVQFWPPSPVARASPLSPTATQLVVVAQLTPRRP